jgi:hypothetical protein
MRYSKSIHLVQCWKACPMYRFNDTTGERACAHPKAPKHGDIIPNNIHEVDFPVLCPLRRENGRHTIKE